MQTKRVIYLVDIISGILWSNTMSLSSGARRVSSTLAKPRNVITFGEGDDPIDTNHSLVELNRAMRYKLFIEHVIHNPRMTRCADLLRGGAARRCGARPNGTRPAASSHFVGQGFSPYPGPTEQNIMSPVIFASVPPRITFFLCSSISMSR